MSKGKTGKKKKELDKAFQRAALFRLWLGIAIGIVALVAGAGLLLVGLFRNQAVPAALGATLLTALVKVSFGSED